MKQLMRLAAAIAVACAGVVAVGGTAMAEPQEPQVGKCHLLYATPPGGGEPVEIVVCP